MIRDATTAFARTLVDEWVRAGVRDAVVAPGSRSAPLALAIADDARLHLHVIVDERSASFFALGLGRATGNPTLLLCTSGTAAANFHPAVLEADHGEVPLLVCTADRPPELRDVGEAQTVDQAHLYGRSPRWFCDVEPPTDVPGVGARWRTLAARAVAETRGSPPGPVHLNLAFREPLVPTGAPLVDAPGRADGAPWTTVARPRRAIDAADLDRVAAWILATPKGIITAGWGAGVSFDALTRFASTRGWPILADSVSGLRAGPGVVSTYDAIARNTVRAEQLRPDLVLQLGAPLTGKPAAQWVGPVPTILVHPNQRWRDPNRAAIEMVTGDVEPFLDALAGRLGHQTDNGWLAAWAETEAALRCRIDAVLDASDELFEGRIARDVMAGLPERANLVVASSMPVRDLESFAAPRAGVAVYANRGVNGIDGFVSTALGVAAGSDRPTVALCGDLSFLHDSNGLLGVNERGLATVFVVVDNGGGGIFSFLPQAALPEHFEPLFGTPPGIDVGGLARAYGVSVAEVCAADELIPALRAAIAAGGVRVLHLRTNRTHNVVQHEAVWAAVAAIAG